MSTTVFPGAVAAYGGMPLSGYVPQIPLNIISNNPTVFFVDGTNGNNGNSGTNPGQAFATITYALNLCTSGNGNIIYIFPGTYEENLTVTTDYVALVGGFAGGYGRPDIGAASGVTLTVQAQGFVCMRCRFFSPAADTDLILHEGNGFLYYDCVFDGDATQGAAKANLRLKGNASDDSFTASEGKILNNLFRGAGGVGLIFDTGDAPDNGVGVTDCLVDGNKFQANDLDIATADTGGGTYSVQVSQISRNHFVDKNKATYIDLTTSNGGAAGDQTGVIDGNYFASDTVTTTKIKMVGTGFTFTGNYYTVGIADGSGLD